MISQTYPAWDKTVVLVTYGRSGSTLVQNLLNALPGALVRGENENLLAPLARAWDILRASQQRADMLINERVTGPHHPWYGFEAALPESFGADLALAFARSLLRPARDTRIAGFKEIRWHNDPALFPVMLDFLRAFFPGVRIVFNLRDHAAVCRSGWWKTMPPEAVRRSLQEAEALYAAYAARHPGACLTLHYERYVTGPAAWRPLFAFLDEPYDADLVQRALDRRLTHLKEWKPGTP